MQIGEIEDDQLAPPDGDKAIAALDLKLTREEVAALEKPYRPPCDPGTPTAQALPHEQIAERARFARGRRYR